MKKKNIYRLFIVFKWTIPMPISEVKKIVQLWFSDMWFHMVPRVWDKENASGRRTFQYFDRRCMNYKCEPVIYALENKIKSIA